MKFPQLAFITGLVLFSVPLFAQDKTNIKYGKISPEDFAPKVYSIDSNANAVVLADIGSTEIVGNSKGWFSLEFKHFKRVHILNKNGYEAANVEIELYTNGSDEEKLDNLKAVTYNLENGKVTETKLDTKAGVFKDVISKYYMVKKFTFPNIKEGSIIEFEYKVQSDFLFNLQPWEFQGEYPVLWSEYNLTRPEFLGYVFLSQGYQQFFIKDQKERRENFHVMDTRGAGASESASFDAGVTDYRWVMKNVPALKEESYTSSISNFIAKLNFQMSDYRYPLTPQSVMGTWKEVCDRLMKSEYFGADLNKNNGWLGDVVKPLIAGSGNDVEKTKRIYTYVRDNITCTSHSARDMDQSLKNLVKTRNGNVAEINLLLTAMLKYANIQADPVILSTRSHGVTYSIYPVLSRFNYVICLAHPGGQDIYLDASQPRLGFGRLTPDCYNGHARIVNDAADAIEFTADSLQEHKVTSILLTADDKGNMEGSLQQMPGYYESHSIRETVKEKGKEEFFKTVQKDYGQDIEIANPKIDSLDNLEGNINISYDFKMKQDKEDIIYLNPMFEEGYKQNPFKSAERFYPVEMPYTLDETYIFSMTVPDGYVVDELPKSTIVKYNEEGEGQFEYRISESGGTISLRSRITMTRTYFQPEEYEVLREFFNMIVKKQNEQIVLKKKK
ncbi:MAG: transglutaminase domain-containing protein [Chitinophagales bacterium]